MSNKGPTKMPGIPIDAHLEFGGHTMEWTTKKPNFYVRSDGYSVAIRDDGGWQAAKPNGLILRDGQEHIRVFGSPEGAQEFCDRFHRLPRSTD